MKRLKYRHLFYGKSIPVMFSLFGVLLLITSVIALDIIKSEWGYIYHMIGSIALILFTLAVDYAVIHHLKPDEKKKIAEASPQKWKKLPNRMKKKFKFDIKESLISASSLIGLELIVAFIMMLLKGVETMLVMLEVVLPVTLVCLASYAVWEHIWANMDDSAIYTKIEVDHSFKVKYTTRAGTKNYSNYIVFYLPDGKYVLEVSAGFVPKNIVVIKYKCFIRWEDANRFI